MSIKKTDKPQKLIFADEQIRAKAYQISQKHPEFSPEENWYAAIKALRKERRFQLLIRIWQWTGISEKKGWDLLPLLLVPFLLAIIGDSAKQREQQAATEKTQQETLVKYLDQMSESIKTDNLLNAKSDTNTFLIAQIRTITALQSLKSDKQRQSAIIQLLRTADLLNPNDSSRIKVIEKKSKSGSQRQDSRGLFYEARMPTIDLQDTDLRGADLRNADLNGADLRNADLNGADLRGADLNGADLNRVRLRGADLRNADLRNANLNRAELIYAKLSGADLRAANLSGANLSGAKLCRTKLCRADLGNTKLRGADLSGANLQGTNLSGAELISADLSGANLIGADLIGANLGGAKLCRAFLWNTKLRGADLSDADLSDADLNYADLNYADLNRANLINANLFGANLNRADLNRANLSQIRIFSAKQIKSAQNWASATYNGKRLDHPEVAKQFGLDTNP